VREKASAELEKAGEAAAHAIRNALRGGAGSEVRSRLRELLTKVEREEGGPSPGRLRALRSLESLVRIGTPEARRLLERLTVGAPQAQLTQEAKASLQRLAQRAVIGQDQ
jgi:hypothetical protein